MAQDPKVAFNTAAQKLAGRPITKLDIVYETTKYDNEYQSTVTLTFEDGHQYAGELASSKKEAEKNAAAQALQAIAPQLAAVVVPQKSAREVRGGKKRKAEEAQEEGGGVIRALFAKTKIAKPCVPIAEGNPANTPKVRLNTLCMKICKRVLQKGEMEYTTQSMQEGFQTTVKVQCLPGEWSGQAWAGELAASKPLAEHNAATQAIDAISKIEELVAAAMVPPRKR